MSQSDFEAQPSGGPVIEPSLAVEGFIHLSVTAEQVTWVANRWYRDVLDLVVLVIDENRLIEPVRYDSTPDGVFPHLYGPLDRKAIVAIEPLQRSDQGNWIVTAHSSFLRKQESIRLAANASLPDGFLLPQGTGMTGHTYQTST